MAISLVNSDFTVITDTSGGDVDVDVISGAQEDDVLVVLSCCDNNMDGVTEAGFESIFSPTGADPESDVAYHIFGSTPITVFSHDTHTSKFVIVMQFILRGVDVDTPIDAVLQFASAASGMPAAPEITTNTDGAWVLAGGFLDDDVITMTAPSGYGNTEAASDATAACSLIGCWKEIATAGTESPAAFGGSGDDDNHAIIVAFKPAAGGALTVNIGVATETDSSLAAQPLRAYALGLVSEADSASSIIPRRDVSIGVVTEADSAFVLSHSKTVQIGIPSETDTVFGIVTPLFIEIGIASETDTVFSINAIKPTNVEIGIAVETDSVFPILLPITFEIGIVIDVEIGLPIVAQTISLDEWVKQQPGVGSYSEDTAVEGSWTPEDVMVASYTNESGVSGSYTAESSLNGNWAEESAL